MTTPISNDSTNPSTDRPTGNQIAAEIAAEATLLLALYYSPDSNGGAMKTNTPGDPAEVQEKANAIYKRLLIIAHQEGFDLHV